MATSRVELVPYDPRWPQAYVDEQERIRTRVGRLLVAVEHIGSTAVPGLLAKPVIDLIAAVRRLDDARELVAPLAGLGYEYVPQYEVDLPERRYFRKKRGGVATHHLHVYDAAEFGRQPQRRFRDFLRLHPQTAQEYARLKLALAERFRLDRRAYTDAKGEFIAAVDAQARADPPAPALVVDTVRAGTAGWPVKAYATGGGVALRDGQVLLLRRRGAGRREVRLPKGHIERGETIAECAVREVREETGLRCVQLGHPLGVVENRFAFDGRRFVRWETWFLMATNDPGTPRGEAQWVPAWYPLAEAPAALTYEAEQAVVRWVMAAVAG